VTDKMEPYLGGMCEDPRRRAAKNLDAAVAPGRRFPENVFRGNWSAFFFFDPDLLFEPQFVESARTFLGTENGTCVCLSNLDAVGTQGGLETSIFLDAGTTGEAYVARLRGPSVASGWLYQMDRYGCTSDVGSWCIYCERNNEIAVIAVHENGAPNRVKSAIEQLNALPVEQAIQTPPSYGLSSRGLPVEWRNKLLQGYGETRRRTKQM
jgi:hypothetical protein